VFASLTVAAGMLLVVTAMLLCRVTWRLRSRVRAASWLLSRAAAAIDEAERGGRVQAQLTETP
jgi:hypothetical protein